MEALILMIVALWMNWDYVQDCYHGYSLVDQVIPNQVFAMTMRSLMTTAFPTVYDVLFGEKYSGVVSVTVSGVGSSSACFVSFGASNNYSSAVSTSTYTGNTIELFVAGFASWIKIDGTAVSHTAGKRYPWTVPTGVRKISIILSTATIGGSTHGFITVQTS